MLRLRELRCGGVEAADRLVAPGMVVSILRSLRSLAFPLSSLASMIRRHALFRPCRTLSRIGTNLPIPGVFLCVCRRSGMKLSTFWLRNCCRKAGMTRKFPLNSSPGKKGPSLCSSLGLAWAFKRWKAHLFILLTGSKLRSTLRDLQYRQLFSWRLIQQLSRECPSTRPTSNANSSSGEFMQAPNNYHYRPSVHPIKEFQWKRSFLIGLREFGVELITDYISRKEGRTGSQGQSIFIIMFHQSVLREVNSWGLFKPHRSLCRYFKCTPQFQTLELKVLARQCLRRYSSEKMRNALPKVSQRVQRLRSSAMLWTLPLFLARMAMKWGYSAPTEASTLARYSACLLMKLKMAFAKFLIMFLVYGCLMRLGSSRKSLAPSPYPSPSISSQPSELSIFLVGRDGRGYTMRAVGCCCGGHELGERCELELLCQLLASWEGGWWGLSLPEPESELGRRCASCLQSRFWRWSSFMMRRFCALMTCIISAVKPACTSSVPQAVPSNLRKADPRPNSSSLIIFNVQLLQSGGRNSRSTEILPGKTRIFFKGEGGGQRWVPTLPTGGVTVCPHTSFPCI